MKWSDFRQMDPAKRSRLLKWLFLLGPIASLLVFGLGAWLLAATGVGDSLNRVFPGAPPRPPVRNWLTPNWMLAAPGWLLLTLGCSVGTCLDLSRCRGLRGGNRVFYVVMLSPLLAVGHISVVAGIVFVGCVAMWKPW